MHSNVMIKAVVRSVRDVSSDDPVETAECILMDADEELEPGEDSSGKPVGESVHHLVVLLNCSESMRGLEDAMLGEFNALLSTYHEAEPETLATLICFAEETGLVAECVPIQELAAYAPSDVLLRGCGIVLDALAAAILHLEESVFASNAQSHVEVAVITNDAEATCCTFAYNEVAALVREKQAAGWKFSLRSVC